MRKNIREQSYLPEDFDIVESTKDSEPEADQVIHAGEIDDWKKQEFSEKAKLRPYITVIVISIWMIIIGLSIAHSLTTGNFLFLIPPALITVPLCIVLRFYFRGG